MKLSFRSQAQNSLSWHSFFKQNFYYLLHYLFRTLFLNHKHRKDNFTSRNTILEKLTFVFRRDLHEGHLFEKNHSPCKRSKWAVCLFFCKIMNFKKLLGRKFHIGRSIFSQYIKTWLQIYSKFATLPTQTWNW